MSRSYCLGRHLGLSIALLLAMASSARAGGVMGLPIAQGLAELQATQQARQQIEGNAAGAAANARPQMNPDNAVPAPAEGGDATPNAVAAGGSGGGILKYLPAYCLIVLFTGLGIAAVGRPVRRLPPDGT